MTGPRAARVAAWLFVGALVATTLVDLVAPLDAPRPVGAELVRAEEAERNARWSDGTRARLIEREGNLTSRVRAALGPAHAAFAVGALGEVPNAVVAGRGGWLFLRSETPLDLRDPERTLARAAALLAAVERRVAAQGVRFVALPAPRKVTIASEVYPAGLDPLPALEGLMLAELRRRGVEALDVRPTLMSLPLEERYYRFDMHWTMRARRAVAEALARHLGAQETALSTVLVEDVESPAPGDTLRMAGIGERSPFRALFPQREHTYYRVEPRGAGPGVGVVSDRMPRVAHFGSSFSGRFAELLAHYLDEDVFGSTQAGGLLVEPLANLRQCYNLGAWPEVITYEYPLHLTLRRAEGTSLTLAVAQNFALSVLPLTPTTTLDVASAATDGDVRFSLPAGRLVTSGDGVAAVRIERAGGAGLGLWRIESDGIRAELPWHAQRSHVLLPILDTGELGAEVRVTAATPDAVAASVTATLVTDLDLAAAVEGVVAGGAGRGAAAEGLAAVVRFPGPTITRHSGVACELNCGDYRGRLELVARTSAGERAAWPARVAGKVTVVLDLSALAGGVLEALEVRTDGAHPCTVSSARFAPQARVSAAR